MSETVDRKISAWRSPWVIGWVALIAVVLTANAAMVVLAIRTNPGLVVADYYDRGQHYEQTMLSKLSRDPGWHTRIDVPVDLVAGRPSPLGVSLVDQAGVPIEVESATLYVYRPSDASRDFHLSMQREAPGRYRTDVSFPLIGVWDVLVSLKQGEYENNHGQRVVVARP